MDSDSPLKLFQFLLELFDRENFTKAQLANAISVASAPIRKNY